jgi:hypothetical protein
MAAASAIQIPVGITFTKREITLGPTVVGGTYVGAPGWAVVRWDLPLRVAAPVARAVAERVTEGVTALPSEPGVVVPPPVRPAPAVSGLTVSAGRPVAVAWLPWLLSAWGSESDSTGAADVAGVVDVGDEELAVCVGDVLDTGLVAFVGLVTKPGLPAVTDWLVGAGPNVDPRSSIEVSPEVGTTPAIGATVADVGNVLPLGNVMPATVVAWFSDD